MIQALISKLVHGESGIRQHVQRMPLPAHLQVLKWREMRSMVALLEGMQDTSECSEACCARLAPCQLPQGMNLCAHV